MEHCEIFPDLGQDVCSRGVDQTRPVCRFWTWIDDASESSPSMSAEEAQRRGLVHRIVDDVDAYINSVTTFTP